MIKKIMSYIDNELNKIPSNQEINILEKRKTYFSSFFYSYVILSISMAFFCQPFLKYIDPTLLFIDGLIMSLGLVSIYRAVVTSVANPKISKKLMFLIFIICFISCLFLSFILFQDGIQNSIEHDRYCFKIQRLIIQNIDAEKNSSIFNNMYCRLDYQNSLLDLKL
ncbi:hypothetical protein SAMN05216563_12514 [Phytobacter palmae]|nr:hypothetical protein SAMN05216563_12514 [Phytobacter palmae]